MNTYTATFSNGKTITRNSNREFEAAWAVIEVSTGQVIDEGFAKNEAAAANAASGSCCLHPICPLSVMVRKHGRRDGKARYSEDKKARQDAHRIEIVKTEKA